MSLYRELRKAESYVTIDGTLHVYADQRTPVMRVMPAGEVTTMSTMKGWLYGEGTFTPRAFISWEGILT